jgi:predicted nucleic acid-binding protein
LSDLVLDASAAVDAAFSRDGFAIYAAHSLHAPALLWWEVNSAVRQHEWRGAISSAIAVEAMRQFHGQAIHRLDPTAELLAAAVQVARRLGWARAYDAAYVAVSLGLGGSRLVTLDQRLQRGASRLVEIVSPADI